MDTVPDRDAEAGGLSRDAVVAAALEVLDRGGVEGLSMRALADRLGVRAASLYWHFRDKEQLLDAVVQQLLDRVPLEARHTGWRPNAASAMDALSRELARHPAVATLILGRPQVVVRSGLVRQLAALLAGAGLDAADTAALALVVEVTAAASLASTAPVLPPPDGVVALHVESGSTRVALRAGSPGMVDVAAGVEGASSIETRADGDVVVRNWRGRRQGAVELNPSYAWDVQVHSGVWNAVLDLAGLRLERLHLDSGSGNIACTLPAPHGVVPVTVSSGIINVTLRRPQAAAARALVHSGCFRLRFDDRPVRVLSSDVVWESSAGAEPDRYEVTVHSGCMRVTLDATAMERAAPVARSAPREPVPLPLGAAVELVLDGIEHRLRR